jgi:predicted phage terminase large subunit-like protein
MASRLTPMQWNRHFLPHYFSKCDPADFHYDFDHRLHDLHHSRGVKHSDIAPRGGAKSTWITLAYVLRASLEKWEPYTLILSDSSDQADQLLGHVRKELEDNEAIASVYPKATGEGPEWKCSRIRLRNGAVVESLGRGKKVRGRRNRAERPSLVIFDDIQSNEDMDSVVKRDRAWAWATREVIPAGDENTNFIAIGSAIHREAVSVRLGQLAGWTGQTYRAVHSWPVRMDLWDEFERLATNLADSDRSSTAMTFYARNKIAMDMGAKVYWPDRFGIAAMMLKRAEIGASAFESEYQGVPGSLEGAEWPSEYFDRPDFWFSDWPPDLVLRVQSLDPSKGASDKADYQAHVLVCLSRYGTLYIDAELRREVCWVERAIDLAQWWNSHELIAEANNTMGLMKPAAEQVIKERKEAGRPVKLNYNERTQVVPKSVRIRVLNDYLRRGQLKVRNTHGGRLLVDQLRDWPNGDHDDGPDALATAVIRIQELAR